MGGLGKTLVIFSVVFSCFGIFIIRTKVIGKNIRRSKDWKYFIKIIIAIWQRIPDCFACLPALAFRS